jgi:NADH-quinone oxidoreductase subunit M
MPGAWAVVGGVGALGVIFGAAYMLYLVQKVFFGPLRNPANEHIPDLTLRELAAVVPLILAAVGMGLFPQPFLDRINPAAVSFVSRTSMGGRQSQQLPRSAGAEVQMGQGGEAGGALRPAAQPIFRPTGAMAPRFVLPHGVQPALTAPSPSPVPAGQPE